MSHKLKWTNTFFLIFMILINIVANLLPLGGNTTGQISAAYPTLFTPAAYAFSIWAIIYILLLVFALLPSGIPSTTQNGIPLTTLIGPWFSISCILNICWIFAWHFRQIGLSVVFIIGLLISLIMINERINGVESYSLIEQIAIHGFQIYLGWITAASIANISVYMTKADLFSFFRISETTWTIIALILGALVGVSYLIFGYHLFSTLAILWAYIGILINHITANGYGSKYGLIIIVTILSIIFMLFFIRLFLLPEKQSSPRDYDASDL